MAFGDKPTQTPQDQANTVGLLQAALAVSNANQRGAGFGNAALQGLAGYTQGAGAATRYASEQEQMKQAQEWKKLQQRHLMGKMARETTQEQGADAFVANLPPEEQAAARAMGADKYMAFKESRQNHEATNQFRRDQLAQDERRWQSQLGQSSAQHAATLALQRDKFNNEKWIPDLKSGMVINPYTGEAKPIIGSDGNPIPAPQAKFDDVNALGKRFTEESKTMRDMSGSLARVLSAGQKDDAPSEMGMVFSFMKMLDPGSTVREGEYAKAEDAKGVPASVLNTYNKLLKGTRLTPEQKGQFVGYARDLWEKEAEQHDIRTKYFTDIAKQRGIPVEAVVQDFTSVPRQGIKKYDEVTKSKKDLVYNPKTGMVE